MRQYIAQKELNDDGCLEIIGKDFRYLKNVLRLKQGDMLQLRLLDGSLKNSTVCRIDEGAKKIVLQICADSESKGENQSDFSNRTDFWLFMFIPKTSKFELILRQATECGVSRIVPIISEFSASGSEKMNFKSERFDRIIKEARQQSGSPVSTEVTESMTLEQAVELWKKHREGNEESFGCVLYERNEKSFSMRKALSGFKSVKKACLVCGSEGGISPDEMNFLLQNEFKSVHFDTNILRCETAALYGIAALQCEICGME